MKSPNTRFDINSISGEASLNLLNENEEEKFLSTVEPGRLIGDLAIITNEPRQLDLVATTDCAFPRIGAEELCAVIESDAGAAVKLLETVAGYLTSVTERLRDPNESIGEGSIPQSPRQNDES